MTGFSVALPIRFGDCDLAGIAYYPRLLALVDAAIEDWTTAIIGLERLAMHRDHRLGLPTVELTTRFERPCRLGERLQLSVRATALGETALTLEVAASVGDEARFSARLVQVLMDIDRMQKAPWPDPWRLRVAAVLAP